MNLIAVVLTIWVCINVALLGLAGLAALLRRHDPVNLSI
jgi:hypothetical protein